MRDQRGSEDNATQALRARHEAATCRFFSIRRFPVRSRSIKVPDANRAKRCITNNNRVHFHYCTWSLIILRNIDTTALFRQSLREQSLWRSLPPGEEFGPAVGQLSS